MPKDISNKTLATLLIVAIAISVIGTFLAASRPVYLTGMATSGTGKVNLSIQAAIAISVTDNIDFGSGYVYQGNASAALISNISTKQAINGSWDWSAKYPGSYPDIQIQNVGNSVCNVSFNASSDASSWIGAGAFAYMAANAAVNDGCSAEQTAWQTLGTGSPNLLCNGLAPTVNADIVDAEAKVIIPSTISGDGAEKSVIVTFYGHTGASP